MGRFGGQGTAHGILAPSPTLAERHRQRCRLGWDRE